MKKLLTFLLEFQLCENHRQRFCEWLVSHVELLSFSSRKQGSPRVEEIWEALSFTTVPLLDN
jgi:hypothetical protein